MSASTIASTVVALDIALKARWDAERLLAELLERIGQVTGVELSTVPGPEQVAAALAVLDSLASPAGDLSEGWHWGDATEGERLGPFDTRDALDRDVEAHADQLPMGHFVARVRDGKLLAPLYVAPSRAGAN